MKSTQDLIEEEFLRLSQQGNVEALILLNDEGIPMAEVGQFTHYNKDAIAALSVVLLQSSELIADFHSDTVVNETSIRTTNKFRIVSRPFQVEDARMMLVAIVPVSASYRNITNKAVQKIRQLMDE
jgi:predicted regulator of Ras-like GTPase activity (Roadblock/LC7/MglB family)